MTAFSACHVGHGGLESLVQLPAIQGPVRRKSKRFLGPLFDSLQAFLALIDIDILVMEASGTWLSEETHGVVSAKFCNGA